MASVNKSDGTGPFEIDLATTSVRELNQFLHQEAAGRGLRHNDPSLAIEWPLPVSRISDRDGSWPLLHKDGLHSGRTPTVPEFTAGR